MKTPPRTLAIVAAGHRADAVQAACEAVAWFERRGVRVYCDGHTAAALGRSVEEAAARLMVDLVLVFGGDGTTISTLRRAAGSGAPVIAVNYGTVGFLTEIPRNGLEPAFERLALGEYEIEERLMLEAVIAGPNGRIQAELAANDVVAKPESATHVLTWRVAVNDNMIAEFPADGMIISTPTGSTAYNLSAGGPVVVPNLSAMILTPICPHTLAARPLVLPATLELTVTIGPFGAQRRGTLSIDGRVDRPLAIDDTLRVRRAEQVMRLARLTPTAFFDSLRGKLRWGNSK